MEKEDKMNHCILLYFYKIRLKPSVGVYKFWWLALIGAEKLVMKNFIRVKEKWTIFLGNNKDEEADSVLYNTTSCSQFLYQISNS